MNKIYEFGGIADVLLRIKVEKEIGGVHYNANEPYTFLKDVTIQFNYEQVNGKGDAKKLAYATNEGRPNQIIINGVPLSQKIANLVLTNNTNKQYKRTRRERVVCYENGKLNLNYTPIDNSIFVYNCNMEIINVYNIDSNVVNGDFVIDNEYLVFYQELTIGDKYSFEIPHFPYFEIDIFMKGNTNKITNDVYMHFDAVSLTTVPNFNIVSGGILNTPLVFNIIYVNQEEPIIVFEE